MRRKFRWGLHFVLGIAASLSLAPQADACHWWRLRGYGWYGGPTVYAPGWGATYVSTGIWGHGFHRSVYYINGGYWPSYSYSSCPTVYYPVTVAPIQYAPVYYPPAVTVPPCETCEYEIEGSTASARYAAQPTRSYARTSQSVRGIARSTRVSSQGVRTRVQAANLDRGGASVRDDLPTLKPYSPVWTESALGLIDDLVARGDWEVARAACQRMERIPEALSPRLAIRHAVLDLVVEQDRIAPSQVSEALDRFDRAAARGWFPGAEEFAAGSLGRYLKGSDIDLAAVLDRLSQQVLERPEASRGELALLSILLALDGQSDRAELFASEARIQAIDSDAFRWRALARLLDGQQQPQALLASQDLR